MQCIYSHCKKSRHLPATFAVLEANLLGNLGHSEDNVSEIAFFTCSDLQRLSNTFVKCQSAEAYLSTLAFLMFRNTPCFHVSMLQSALPLSTFAFRSRGSGPQPLGSHCSPLARGSLGTPGALSEPLPSARARVGSRATFLHISRHMRALD